MGAFLRVAAVVLLVTAIVDPLLERLGGGRYVSVRSHARRAASGIVDAIVQAVRDFEWPSASSEPSDGGSGWQGAPLELDVNTVASTAEVVTVPAVMRVGAPARVAVPATLDHGRARERVAQAARRLLGTPYDWGGENEDGVDCSGLIVVAYREVGVELPHRSRILFRLGTPVPITEVQPGDLVFFHNSNGKADHVGMYLGDGAMIHASTGQRRVVIVRLDEVAYANGLSGARRFIDAEHAGEGAKRRAPRRGVLARRERDDPATTFARTALIPTSGRGRDEESR